jgi:3-methyladenine DNA glycosylase/8-oxoguanine DNA glycosylase
VSRGHRAEHRRCAGPRCARTSLRAAPDAAALAGCAPARLGALPGVGAWTVDCLALHGQGRYDVIPARDLGLRKLPGLSDGDRPSVAQDY